MYVCFKLWNDNQTNKPKIYTTIGKVLEGLDVGKIVDFFWDMTPKVRAQEAQEAQRKLWYAYITYSNMSENEYYSIYSNK